MGLQTEIGRSFASLSMTDARDGSAPAITLSTCYPSFQRRLESRIFLGMTVGYSNQSGFWPSPEWRAGRGPCPL